MIEAHGLTHWYQPIRQVSTGKIIGYEALLRSKHQYGLSPLDIFEQAEQQGYRTILDRQLMFKAISSIERTSPYPLFLNVFPSTLLESSFLSCWDEHMIANYPLILEISETEPINNWKTLNDVISELRQRGVKIALDDMGAGYSFFQHWIELKPEYIKLDRYYSNDLMKSQMKQQVLESLVKLFKGSTKLVLEGIETKEDLETAKDLGISYAQGYLLGKPSPLENASAENGFREVC